MRHGEIAKQKQAIGTGQGEPVIHPLADRFDGYTHPQNILDLLAWAGLSTLYPTGDLRHITANGNAEIIPYRAGIGAGFSTGF
ncbi:hypothetical protein D3C85_1441270 [compost metagenome]